MEASGGWFREGAAVDLFSLPVPVFSEFDGGPTITAGVTLVRDPEHGLNAGTYRFQIKERALTGIDIVTPNNLRRLAEKALAANAPLPISINIGTHPLELMASLYKAPLGRDELAIAGGMLGRAVRPGCLQDHRRAVPGGRRDRARGGDPAHGLDPPGRPVRRDDAPYGRRAPTTRTCG